MSTHTPAQAPAEWAVSEVRHTLQGPVVSPVVLVATAGEDVRAVLLRQGVAAAGSEGLHNTVF